MRLTAPCSLGLVLALAALAQAQSETENSRVAQVTDQINRVYQLTNPYPDINYSLVFSDGHDGSSGLGLAPVDEATRIHLKLPKGQGLIATSVVPQGSAAQAGIVQNDILLTLDDAPLAKPEDLEERLKAAGDKTLKLALLHQGHRRSLPIQPKFKVTFGPPQPEPPEFWIGVSVSSVEPALRDQLQIGKNQGLLATGVIDNSPAAKSGLKVNDILLSSNGKPLNDPAELVNLVQKNGEKPIAFEVLKEGVRKIIEVTPEKRKDPHWLTTKHAGVWNVVHPGAVLQDDNVSYVPNSEVIWSWNDLVPREGNLYRQGADPLASRLDTMAAELKELRKAVEELSKAIKDRK